MSKKKKIIIIVCSILILLGIGTGLYFYFKPEEKKDEPKSEEREVVEKETVKIKENLTVDSGSELDITDFFENTDGLSLNVEIEYLNVDESLEDRGLMFKTLYYDKDGVLVDEATAIENGILKDDYSSKNVLYSIGVYEVKISDIDKKEIYYTKLTVNDKTAPELEVVDVEITEGEHIEISNFIISCNDNSFNECFYSLKDGEKFDATSGTRKYEIIARDEFGNESIKEVTLKVNKKPINTNNSNNSSGSAGSSNSSSSNNSSGSNSSTGSNNSNSSNSSSSNGSSTGNNNGGNNSSNTNSNVETKKEVVSTKEEYGSEEISYKYGVKIITKPFYLITEYSDGSEEKSLIRSEVVSYDYSTFNGTTSQMKGEASSVASSNNSKYNELLNYVNQYRSEAGVAPLTMASDLNTAATIRAIEMAWSDTFSHTRPNGSSCFTVYKELGLGYNYMGENIAWNYGSTKSVSEGWKNSPGHYANMISTNYTKVGFGMYTVEGDIYWVQLFGN